MYLLSFRILGLPAIPSTTWISVDKGLNLVRTFTGEQAQSLFKVLQSINPPYSFESFNPFRNLPLKKSGHLYARQIIPYKNTAAIAIFSATSDLVKELAEIDPALYEIDRIEIGRRRDFSRWINFIELSSSTRWSEIESTVTDLLTCLTHDAALAIKRLKITTKDLHSTDRIKGVIATEIRERLEELRCFVPGDKLRQLDQCIQAVDRAKHFMQAKEIVEKHLPHFLTIPSDMFGHNSPNVDTSLVAENSSEPLTFLFNHYRKEHAAQISLMDLVNNLNVSLQKVHPGLSLHFNNEKISVAEDTQNSFALSITEMLPVHRIDLLLVALAALHMFFYGCYPIFLVDISRMNLSKQNLAVLFSVLLRHASHWQFLVIPDDNLLKIFKDSFESGKENKHSPISLI